MPCFISFLLIQKTFLDYPEYLKFGLGFNLFQHFREDKKAKPQWSELFFLESVAVKGNCLLSLWHLFSIWRLWSPTGPWSVEVKHDIWQDSGKLAFTSSYRKAISRCLFPDRSSLKKELQTTAPSCAMREGKSNKNWGSGWRHLAPNFHQT